MVINSMDFAKPKVYEIVNCEDRMGIIYDRMEGECLLDLVIRTCDIQSCAVYMAQLHRTSLHNMESQDGNLINFEYDR